MTGVLALSDSPQVQEALHDFPDLHNFLEVLKKEQGWVNGRTVCIARAPGRLDVMGGISDYSGGLVLQLPIDRACFAATQRLEDPIIEITSLRHDLTTSEYNSLNLHANRSLDGKSLCCVWRTP